MRRPQRSWPGPVGWSAEVAEEVRRVAGERAWLGDLLTSVASAPPEMAVSVLAQLLARRLAATEV